METGRFCRIGECEPGLPEADSGKGTLNCGHCLSKGIGSEV